MDKLPCYYARDYQIPDSPKLNLLLDDPLDQGAQVGEVVKWSIEYEVGGPSGPEIIDPVSTVSLDDFFENKKVTVDGVKLNSTPLKGILKKANLSGLKDKVPAFSDSSELDPLIPLFKTLGVSAHLDDYISQVNLYLKNQPEFSPTVVKNNIQSITNLLDIYHKFRVQAVDKKSRPFLPVSYKQTRPPPNPPKKAQKKKQKIAASNHPGK